MIRTPSQNIAARLTLTLGAIACAAIGSCAKPAAIRPIGEAPVAARSALAFSNGSYAEIAGDYGRLADDIPRAVKKVHWGLLTLDVPTTQPTTTQPSASPPIATPRPPIRAEALAPDGRSVFIVAWAPGKNRVAVAVRGGRFGAPDLESLFVTQLQAVLAGKPKPKRGGTFTIPD